MIANVRPENLKIKFWVPDETELLPKIVVWEIAWSIVFWCVLYFPKTYLLKLTAFFRNI
jgi:hypothetical protein